MIDHDLKELDEWSKKWLMFFNPDKTEKSLKIPKGQSETVYRRRTDNTMVKRKSHAIFKYEYSRIQFDM